MTLRDLLRRWRNPDGGWGYSPGKRTRLEPTCLALLALAGPDEPAAGPLEQWPVRGGLLVDGADLPPNFAFNGLALLTMTEVAPSLAGRAAAVAAALAATRGVAFDRSDALGQDNRLRAWPWVDETFSWVEPTAWCLLGLKKWRRAARAPGGDGRVAEAERLMLDRVCETGGWNYGNPRVLDRALPAYVPTSALGLLALQDRRDHPLVEKSLSFLEREALTEPSALALSLSAVALDVLGRPAESVVRALEACTGATRELGQICGLALAAYVLEDTGHEHRAFRL